MGFRKAFLSPRAVPQSVPAGITALPAEDVRALVAAIFG
jgi:hypothetical protein